MDGLLGLAVASGIKGYYLLESDSSFIESASFALSQGKFASSKLAPLADTQFCANPLESQQIGKNECVGGKCSGNGTTSAGVRVFEQNNKIAESAEGGKFEYSNIDEREVSRFFGYKSTQHMINSISPIKAKLN